MNYRILIPTIEGFSKVFYLDFCESRMSRKFKVDNVCIIEVFKFHDHRYDLKSFFYKTEHIYCYDGFRSKKELYSAIQKLLQENL